MLNALKLQVSNPGPTALSAAALRPRFTLRLPKPRCNFASFTVQTMAVNASSDPSVPSNLTSTVGFSSAIHQSLDHRHIRILIFFACAAAISATWLFCSAIPALLAFKRAAESLEKLMDVTREELPNTMAAVRY